MAWAEELHPRNPAGSPDGGQFTGGGGGLAAVVAATSKPDGGFTYSPVTDSSPKEGFALSIYKGHEHVIDAKDLTAKTLWDYAKSNWGLLKQDGNYFGGWHNPEDGKVYLDVSRVVDSEKEAERLCKEHNQLAYFDLKNGQSVSVAHAMADAYTNSLEVPYAEAKARAGRSGEGSAVSEGHRRALQASDWTRPRPEGHAADRVRAQGHEGLRFDDANGSVIGSGPKGQHVQKIGDVIHNAKSVRYQAVPGLSDMHVAMGVPVQSHVMTPEYAAARKRLFSSRAVERVPTKSLVFTQQTVDMSKVTDLSKSDYGKRAPVWVVQAGEKNYVVDGSHRSVAAWLNGKDTVNAQVFRSEGTSHRMSAVTAEAASESWKFEEDWWTETERKLYSPDQPRDDHGRWGWGGVATKIVTRVHNARASQRAKVDKAKHVLKAAHEKVRNMSAVMYTAHAYERIEKGAFIIEHFEEIHMLSEVAVELLAEGAKHGATALQLFMSEAVALSSDDAKAQITRTNEFIQKAIAALRAVSKIDPATLDTTEKVSAALSTVDAAFTDATAALDMVGGKK